MADASSSGAGEGHRTEFGSLVRFIRATGDETGGAFSVMPRGTPHMVRAVGGPARHLTCAEVLKRYGVTLLEQPPEAP